MRQRRDGTLFSYANNTSIFLSVCQGVQKGSFPRAVAGNLHRFRNARRRSPIKTLGDDVLMRVPFPSCQKKRKETLSHSLRDFQARSKKDIFLFLYLFLSLFLFLFLFGIWVNYTECRCLTHRLKQGFFAHRITAKKSAASTRGSAAYGHVGCLKIYSVDK